MKKKRDRKRWRTFFRFADLIFFITHGHGFACIFDVQDNVLLVVHADIRITDKMHDEVVFASLWRSLELHFKC